MARTHYVKKARKDQGACRSPHCRHESRAITEGMAYKWFSIRTHRGGRGQRFVYHTECRVPMSHTTTSHHLATIYDAVESAEDAVAALTSDSCTAEDFRTIAQEAADGIREAAESYRESAENIESGFGHSTSMSDELNEKADAIDSWADDLESMDFDEWDEDAAESAAHDEAGEDFTADDIASAVDTMRDEWFDGCVSDITDKLGENPL